jgi:hypothetical protein
MKIYKSKVKYDQGQLYKLSMTVKNLYNEWEWEIIICYGKTEIYLSNREIIPF